jgi:HAD superfamily hydrolase (TIGR01459 family)
MTPTTLDWLAPRYDAFLIDQFGVLLNGAGAYPGAPATLLRLAGQGKRILLLSNSGKRQAPNIARLLQLGFDRSSFEAVLSSGEAAHALLTGRIGGDLAAGSRVWLHARDGDTSQIEGLPLTLVDTPAEADLLVLAGSQTDELSLADYRALLGPAAERGIPCLCTNPDMEMLTAHGLRPGAGAIAKLYADLGGRVEWIGKPYPFIYEEALRRLAGIPSDRILCIGDSPEHDILGAHRAGLAAALVRTGIHDGLSDPDRHARSVAAGAVAEYLLDRFAFEDERTAAMDRRQAH